MIMISQLLVDEHERRVLPGWKTKIFYVLFRAVAVNSTQQHILLNY